MKGSNEHQTKYAEVCHIYYNERDNTAALYTCDTGTAAIWVRTKTKLKKVLGRIFYWHIVLQAVAIQCTKAKCEQVQQPNTLFSFST